MAQYITQNYTTKDSHMQKYTLKHTSRFLCEKKNHTKRMLNAMVRHTIRTLGRHDVCALCMYAQKCIYYCAFFSSVFIILFLFCTSAFSKYVAPCSCAQCTRYCSFAIICTCVILKLWLEIFPRKWTDVFFVYMQFTLAAIFSNYQSFRMSEWRKMFFIWQVSPRIHFN